MKTPLITIAILFVVGFPAAVSAQTSCPIGFICLTQEQANSNAAKLREREVLLSEKIPALEAQVKSEQQNVRDVKETAQKNEIALRDQNIKLMVELATKTGQLIGAEASVVRLTAENQFLVPMVRKKCLPFSVCF